MASRQKGSPARDSRFADYGGHVGNRQPGLYESLITEALESELRQVPEQHKIERAPLRHADVGDRIALHVGRILDRAISSIDEQHRTQAAVRIAREIIEQIRGLENAHKDPDDERPTNAGEHLRAILTRLPDGSPAQIPAPLTPLLDTTVLTNAPGEPRIGKQVLSEVGSADRIDLVMAFIRQSGLKPLQQELRRFCESGRTLRVLTTTYTQSTQLSALEQLRDLGAAVRVSYDTSCTRLHAKSWIFHRDSGFSTAFIGSSNLTYSAQVNGLEWNVRASGARNPDVTRKMAAVFEAYWNSGDFLDFDPEEFLASTASAEPSSPSIIISPIEVHPWPFQERLLEQLALSRARGHDRNLLVAATGTGKTVMAAVDYLRLTPDLDRARLLFVAHRKEILDQSRATFRHVLRKPDFGELWVDGGRPRVFEHVFASIQSLHASGLSHLPADHFDVVIVDEFHHAAAPSYQRLLDHVQPRELLGLTATPERSDGLEVLPFFGGRIAAELRLWDAIDQNRLSPFAYYGVHDNLDLRKVPWRRGAGYDIEGLTNLMTGNDVWARQVLQSLNDHVDDVSLIRALGFCVSVAHARFMARVFSEAGVPSAAVWGDSAPDERQQSLNALRERKINVLFSVDLFNEGLDLPDVDTLLMLRPTESPTLFLQQLGRGLRRTPDKRQCTVLDFVGHHRKEFRYDRRLLALFGGTRRDVERQVSEGFPLLPAGCHMQLDEVAEQIVLDSLKQAIPSRWPAKVAELRRQINGGSTPSFAGFLLESGLEPEDIYAGNRSWGDLQADAGLPLLPPGPDESPMRRAIGRLLHVDDTERIDTWLELLASIDMPDLASMPERRRRLARMLVSQLGDQVFKKGTPLGEGWERVWRHPQVRGEICALLQVLRPRGDHLHQVLQGPRDTPLLIHARYSRIEIFAAFGVGDGARVTPWQTGVRWLPEQGTDLLAFTLDKASGTFSPTTRYRDYAISRELIHWESQGVVRAESDTGVRYQEHARRGSRIMLFARLRQDERSFWFLGPATYVEHRGEKPMGITWRLEYPLPGDLFARFAAAVA